MAGNSSPRSSYWQPVHGVRVIDEGCDIRVRGRQFRLFQLTFSSLALLPRPNDALILLRHGCHAFIHELLDALALEGLGRIDVALGIDCDAMHAEEFTRYAPAVAEAGQNVHRRAIHDVHFLVLAIGEIDVLLLRILGECDLPSRPGPQRLLRDKNFLHEGPIWIEYLDAVVHTIADVYQIVVGQHHAMHRVGELLAGRGIRIVFPQVGVVGPLSVRAPMPLVFPGVGIVHDHTVIAVAIGHVHFIGLGVHKYLRDAFDVLGIVAALAFLGLADLKQKFSRLGEFQYLVVMVDIFIFRIAPYATIAANPDITLVVDRDPVFAYRPVVALTRAAPMPDHVAIFVELDNRRALYAALGGRRIAFRMQLTSHDRFRTMNHPDMILCVHRHANGHANAPVVR